MLVTVSGDDTAEGATLRLWDLAARRVGEAPPAMRPLEGVRLASPKLPLPTALTAIAVHGDGWPSISVAAGLADGSVYLLRGDAGVFRVLEDSGFFRA